MKKEALLKDVTEAVQGYLLFKADQEIDNSLSTCARLLKDRREELTLREIKKEYGKGRLYRFSSDTTEILKSSSAYREAYLLIDMKDFARKTSRIKEIAMADFMKVRFFKPIMEVAKRYGLGKEMAEGVGIKVRNILGDAILFSGNISSLVFLAEDIQKIIDGYRKELTEKLPEEVLRKAMERVRRTYREAMEQERESTLGLADERRLLEEACREELEELAYKEIMVGLYISYGTKAEEILLRDNVGQVE